MIDGYECGDHNAKHAWVFNLGRFRSLFQNLWSSAILTTMPSIASFAAPLLSVLLLSTKTLAVNVTLDYATFVGTASYTSDSGTTLPNALVAYLGIPYAAPPTGERRYAYPQAPLKVNGTVSATTYGPTCLQPGTGDMSEDCLSLNVFAPKGTTESSKLPVVIWSMLFLLYLLLRCSITANQYTAELSTVALGVVSLHPWFQTPPRIF
jgi:hypothetical protein